MRMAKAFCCENYRNSSKNESRCSCSKETTNIIIVTFGSPQSIYSIARTPSRVLNLDNTNNTNKSHDREVRILA
jgi:hypothetical protein